MKRIVEEYKFNQELTIEQRINQIKKTLGIKLTIKKFRFYFSVGEITLRSDFIKPEKPVDKSIEDMCKNIEENFPEVNMYYTISTLNEFNVAFTLYYVINKVFLVDLNLLSNTLKLSPLYSIPMNLLIAPSQVMIDTIQQKLKGTILNEINSLYKNLMEES